MVAAIPAGRPSQRRGRVLFATLVVLCLMGGAGFYWFAIPRIIQSEMQPAQNQAQTANVVPPPAATTGIDEPGRPITDDEPAFWSHVAIYKAGPDRERPIVVIERGEQPDSNADEALYQGLLAREVVRQALLIAAREEFGALTRDMPIGDPGLSGTPDATFRIGSRFRLSLGSTPDDPAVGRITIVQGRGPDRKVLWSREFECEMIIAPEYRQLVTRLERYSREDFREILEAQGLARSKPAPTNPESETLPDGVAEQLEQPTETQQFAAIRALHQTIRTQGENTNLLLALARAYAQLGSLAECQWTADYLAFQARGLLYAQRALARDEDQPATLRGRAYIESLTGLCAQSDLDLGDADKNDGGEDLPDWVAMIRAFNDDDAFALAKYAEDHPDATWPLYLRFLTVLRSSGAMNQSDQFCRHEILEASRPILEKVPDCYRVIDGLNQMSGVANLHTASMIGLELYPRSLRKRLDDLPDLPDSVLGPAPKEGEVAEVGIRRRLDAAGADDPADLTWGVLARQFREIRFFLVGHRLSFISGPLSASADDFARKALPWVADHRNRAYVESFIPERFGPDTLRKLHEMDIADLEWKARPIFQRFERIEPPRFEHLKDLAWEHKVLGTTPGQIMSVLYSADDEGRAAMAHNLLKYHPGSPLGRAALIATNWPEAQPKAEFWEEDNGGQDTPVIAALGFHALKEGNDEKAEQLLKQALERSPEAWIFSGLAAIYVKRGDFDAYAEAVTDFLETDDLSLDHATVAGDLARALMAVGDYEKARPFAEIAAQSWAGWAMEIALQCAHEMKDWERAELWASRLSERYANRWLIWFRWCMQTGHGDARAAARLVEAQIAAGRPIQSLAELQQVATIMLLDDKLPMARDLLESAYAQNHDMTVGTLLALACDRAGDAEARDQTLKAITEDPNPSGPNTAKILGILAAWLKKGDDTPLDLEAIQAIVGPGSSGPKANTAAIIGLFLERHGQTEAALEFLKQADDDQANRWFRFLARQALQDHDIPLEPITDL